MHVLQRVAQLEAVRDSLRPRLPRGAPPTFSEASSEATSPQSPSEGPYTPRMSPSRPYAAHHEEEVEEEEEGAQGGGSDSGFDAGAFCSPGRRHDWGGPRGRHSEGQWRRQQYGSEGSIESDGADLQLVESVVEMFFDDG